jgi:hypothetical protein
MSTIDSSMNLAIANLLSRRRLLLKAVIFPLNLYLTASLVACNNASRPEELNTVPSSAPDSVELLSHAGNCPGYEALTPQDEQMRRALSYVDVVENHRTCAACQFYTAPASGDACGSCTILRGPVLSTGYCTTWVA